MVNICNGNRTKGKGKERLVFAGANGAKILGTGGRPAAPRWRRRPAAAPERPSRMRPDEMAVVVMRLFWEPGACKPALFSYGKFSRRSNVPGGGYVLQEIPAATAIVRPLRGSGKASRAGVGGSPASPYSRAMSQHLSSIARAISKTARREARLPAGIASARAPTSPGACSMDAVPVSVGVLQRVTDRHASRSRRAEDRYAVA